MAAISKPLAWLSGDIRSPPFSTKARLEAGYLLRQLQNGEALTMPHSRPMPSIGAQCHKLRILDRENNWRIVYRVDADAILILEVFRKKTVSTPKSIIDNCKQRAKGYDHAGKKASKS